MDSMKAIIKDEVLLKNQEYINQVDDFDYWNEHIKLVVHYAIELAKKYDADLELVELGALLHDISSVLNVGTRQEHHIHGARIAVELLK